MSAPAPVAADPSVPWKHASQKLKELGGLSGISLVEELSEVTVAVGGRPHFKCDLSMDIDA